jgi:hypothetical protein
MSAALPVPAPAKTLFEQYLSDISYNACDRLRTDARTASLLRSSDPHEITQRLQEALTLACRARERQAPGATAASLQAKSDLDGLVEVLVGSLHEPMPLGEDLFISMIEVVKPQLIVDDRVAHLLEALASAEASAQKKSLPQARAKPKSKSKPRAKPKAKAPSRGPASGASGSIPSPRSSRRSAEPEAQESEALTAVKAAAAARLAKTMEQKEKQKKGNLSTESTNYSKSGEDSAPWVSCSAIQCFCNGMSR